MKRGIAVALVLAGCLAAGLRIGAQTPADVGQNKPAGTQAPSGSQAGSQTGTQTASPSGANSFPEDTSSVPVLPSRVAPVLPEGTSTGPDAGSGMENVRLPGDDTDPVRSPDDPAPEAGGGPAEDSSSSLAGLDKLLPPPDDETTGKHKKLRVAEPEHRETAAEDINVGGYYLERKNWKAALSRFQSAMVLDPENPDVFWGLAEAERHLGDFWDARGHYQTVVDYDPDSKHGKEARKALKEPEIANAKKAATVQVGTETGK